jgi:Mg2+-importing ATPase
MPKNALKRGNKLTKEFWSVPAAHQLKHLGSTAKGLGGIEAKERLQKYGANRLATKKKTDSLSLFLAQFSNPLVLILIACAVVSFFLGDSINAVLILLIVLASGLLGFWQENGAMRAIERLTAIVAVEAEVLRDGKVQKIPLADIVPGDIVLLAAGDTVPSDCLVLESDGLQINEAAITGEAYPVPKTPGAIAASTPFAKRTNSLFMGTHVVSGSGKVLVVRTGKETEFGIISQQLQMRIPETEFERGVRRFGYLLMQVTLILVAAIFAINAMFQRPLLESALFAVALAVGLTPQLLPAIISVNLSHGARKMAEKKVIVKRLESIENFGSMNVLCCDKTGTLTEGIVSVHSARAIDGKESNDVMKYAYLNASFQKGFDNPIDAAIKDAGKRKFSISGFRRIDELPYTFSRKRVSVLLTHGRKHILITKGAVPNVLALCKKAELEGRQHHISRHKAQILRQYEEFGRRGFRTLAVAYRDVNGSPYARGQEKDMVFAGLLVLYDPPKPGIVQTLNRFKQLGITLKIITGDNRIIAEAVAHHAGISKPKVMSGRELNRLNEKALRKIVNDVDVFAEVEPQQKDRIITALKAAGNVVGFLGDGINDAPAMHTADVGISVNDAVDVAKEAADIVLLEKNLGVLVQGISEGRTTFANTLKYVFMATSANFGNMFSMAGASLLMSFLPLLPKQVLLMNLLNDLPEMAIARDRVDPELVDKPRKWDMAFIRKFMIVFGLLSSVFDYLTFFVLLWVLHASPAQFRAGWFIESIASAAGIVLVIRTRRPFFVSWPSALLAFSTFAVIGLAAILPFTGLGRIFGFVPLGTEFYVILGLMLVAYVVLAEIIKVFFYKYVKC